MRKSDLQLASSNPAAFLRLVEAERQRRSTYNKAYYSMQKEAIKQAIESINQATQSSEDVNQSTNTISSVQSVQSDQSVSSSESDKSDSSTEHDQIKAELAAIEKRWKAEPDKERRMEIRREYFALREKMLAVAA